MFFSVRLAWTPIGAVVKTNICSVLRATQHDCEDVVVYEAVYSKNLDSNIVKELANFKTILLPVFSEISAVNAFNSLKSDAFEHMRTRTKLLCLSSAVLQSVSENNQGGEYVCKFPNLESMYDLIKEVSDE